MSGLNIQSCCIRHLSQGEILPSLAAWRGSCHMPLIQELGCNLKDRKTEWEDSVCGWQVTFALLLLKQVLGFSLPSAQKQQGVGLQNHPWLEVDITQTSSV